MIYTLLTSLVMPVIQKMFRQNKNFGSEFSNCRSNKKRFAQHLNELNIEYEYDLLSHFRTNSVRFRRASRPYSMSQAISEYWSHCCFFLHYLSNKFILHFRKHNIHRCDSYISSFTALNGKHMWKIYTRIMY